MALSYSEMCLLQQACSAVRDGPDYRCNDYVENLLLTALDFYMRVETVNNALSFFRATHGFVHVQELNAVIDQYEDDEGGNRALAQFLWDNQHRTRAKFLRKIIEEFEGRKITNQTSLCEWLKTADFDRDVKGKVRTTEHSMGIAIFNWLCLRCGLPTIKPDRHVLNFLRRAIGRMPSPEEAISALRAIARETGREPHRLDAAIWHFERAKYDGLRSEDAIKTPQEIRVGATVRVLSSWDDKEWLGRIKGQDSIGLTVEYHDWGDDWEEHLPISAVRYM